MSAPRVLKGEPVDLDDLDDLSGYTDGEVEGGIRDFQEQTGLKVDDWMAPGGATERNMVAALTGEGLDTARPQEVALRQGVGSGGANGAEDVKTIKRALGSLGYLKYDRTAPPMPYIDAKTVEGIQKFQRDNGLMEDGRATPDGETERALKEKLAEKRKDGVQVANMGPILNLGSKILRLIFKESKSGKPKPNTPSPAPKPDPRKEAVDRMGREIANEAARKSGEETARKVEEERKKRKPTLLTKDLPFTPLEDKVPDRMEHIPPNIPEFDPEDRGFQPHERDRKDGIFAGPDPDAPPVILSDKPEGFPLPAKPEDLIEIFPDEREKWSKPLILENRGNEQTRQLNTRVRKLADEIINRKNLPIRHIGGARDDEENEIKEIYLKNPATGRLGSSHIDISFENIINKRRLHINSTDVLADGITPDKRESEAIVRILGNKNTNDLGASLPKEKLGKSLNWDAVEDFLEYLLDEIAKDQMVGRETGVPTRPAVDQWHQWKGPLK